MLFGLMNRIAKFWPVYSQLSWCLQKKKQFRWYHVIRSIPKNIQRDIETHTIKI